MWKIKICHKYFDICLSEKNRAWKDGSAGRNTCWSFRRLWFSSQPSCGDFWPPRTTTDTWYTYIYSSTHSKNKINSFKWEKISGTIMSIIPSRERENFTSVISIASLLVTKEHTVDNLDKRVKWSQLCSKCGLF